MEELYDFKNTAYDISENNKIYEASVLYSLKPNKVNIVFPKKNLEIPDKAYFEIIHSSTGEIYYKNRQLINKVLNFYYYIPVRNTNNIEDIYNFKTTLNNKDYYIAGRYITAKTGLIRSVNHLITSDKKYYKISVSIEIEHEKPLYSDFYPNVGYYFYEGGDSSKKRRIQFSSNPSRILSDKTNFPDAIHVANGFGYYSDFHSELNIPEPIPLKENGDIASDYQDISWNESFEHFVTSWKSLCLPEKVYGV